MKQNTPKKNLTKTTSDTLSETISFVIKGKLTPIKPTYVAKKIKKEKPNPKVSLKTKATKNVKAVKKNPGNVAPKKTTKSTNKPTEKNPKTENKSKSVKAKPEVTKKKSIKKETKKVEPVTTPSSLAKIKKQEEIEKKKTIKKLIQNATKMLKQTVTPKIKSSKNAKKIKKNKTKESIKKETAKMDHKNKTEKTKVKTETSDKIEAIKKSPLKQKTKNAISVKTKKLKKSVPSKQVKNKKLKLYGLWNSPKKQRVASLNAIAKVHCLYENEVKGSLIDMDIPLLKKEETEEESDRESPIPQRTLRCLPGLRAVGKHWDMHDSSSSSDENEDFVESIVKKEDNKKPEVQKKRKRKQTEIIMDLKDMVVKKRMASLNATAILAASYEKRSVRGSKSSSSSSDSSEDESDVSEELNKCLKKEKIDDDKTVEVRGKSNKNVVILNQDTDVTITGVYVNSTTRSTHHEGYCSIAGMQYRISATSHTQTAATAVATETLLQTSNTGPQENTNTEPLNAPCKSYAPLDALSNMRPPTADGHQGMGPPHVMTLQPHPPLSPGAGGVRHSCSSAFTAPHAACHPPAGHPAEPSYVHGYYQPAGPLITVPHGHPQPPLTKSAPLSESSPTSPSPLTPHPTHLTGSGDSSDNEVLKSSIVKEIPPGPAYRYPLYPQSGPPPAGYSYSYPPHYYHPTPPPTYSHDMCYSTPYGHHKITPGYSHRRYLQGTQYYTSNPPPDIYQVPPAHGQNQQLVTSNPSGSGGYQPPQVPPPTIIETYAPALVETYSPHYYPYNPAPPSGCFTHAPPSRAMPYMSGSYQNCPCPMQSCPKNGLTGPLTGDGKRSTNLPKNTMPLPPVALALPKEPTSDGPPSPARGSAGMPPPPSPAGAVYQPPTPKQENPSPENELPQEKKRKARVGKAMVRSNMQNTMLLMPLPQNVKREIESPKEKECNQECKVDSQPQEIESRVTLIEKSEALPEVNSKSANVQMSEIKIEKEKSPVSTDLPLEPVVNSVAENVKVKNMKRKMSLIPDKKDDLPSPPKQIKIVKTNGSYKDLIKKKNAVRRVGRRKILKSMLTTKMFRRTKRKQKRIDNNNTIILSKNMNLKQMEAKKLTAPKVLDNLINKNSVDRVIDSVVSEVRTGKKSEKRAKDAVKEDMTPLKNAKGKKAKKSDLPSSITRIPRRSVQAPRWSNGWSWEGDSFDSKVFLNSDETTVIRKCYPAMRHDSGDILEVRDCVLLKAGVRKNELPFVAKIAALWENPEDGEMMMSLLWYYRPEHTEQGRLPTDQVDEVFASRHKDSNSVACIDDKCYVLTFNEYCRYRKILRRLELGIEEDTTPCIPCQEQYPRLKRQPPENVKLSPDMVFFCRRVYDFRQKRIVKNPT